MSFLKQDLTKKEKVVKIISLLLFAFSIVAMGIGFVEEKSAMAAQKRVEESYIEYEGMVSDELSDIKELGYSVIKLSFNQDTQGYVINTELLSKCNTFIYNYSNYVSDEPIINEIHMDVMEAVTEIYEGSSSLNDTVANVINNKRITTQDLDNQSESMEEIAWGSNFLSNIIGQIKYRSYNN